MSKPIRPIFENGVFRPIEPIPNYGEGSRVVITVQKPLDKEALRAFRGTLSAEEAEEMNRVIQEGRRVEGTG